MVRDCSTAATDQVLSDRKAETNAWALDLVVARDTLLVNDVAACGLYRSFPNTGVRHPERRPEHERQGKQVGRLSHPALQRLYRPPQTMDARVPWRRRQISSKLSGLTSTTIYRSQGGIQASSCSLAAKAMHSN